MTEASRRVALGALIGLAVAALDPSTARAGASEQIHLQAVVPVRCGIEITRHDAALDLAAGFNRARVATIVESCNQPSGYTLTFSSASAGTLVRGDAAIRYTARYGGREIGLGKPAVLGRVGPEFGIRRDLAISAPASSGLLAGIYQDVITVTITAR